MDWYIVIKTIKGRRYYYRQKTWREGKRVRTLSQYIGPVGGESSPAAGPTEPITAKGAGPKFDEAHAEKALELVLGTQSDDWEHHWDADRSGENLVVRDKRIDRMLGSLGISWTHNTQGAYFRPATGEVNIPPEKCFSDKNDQTATQAYYVVLFHEVVHWTQQCVARPIGYRGIKYAREELVAELGAVTLMQHFGLQLGNPGRHAKYFQVWLSRAGSQKAALAHAKRQAAAAVRFILEHGKMRHDPNS